MSIALYMDENVPLPITNGLRQRDVDVLRAQEDNHQNTPDTVILDRATDLQRVVFTQDEDFLAIANRRQQEEVNFSRVIYAHQQNVTFGDCIRDLEIIAKVTNLSHSSHLLNSRHNFLHCLGIWRSQML
jgi:predicted nuclease of predicted toxin-antitoxin system